MPSIAQFLAVTSKHAFTQKSTNKAADSAALTTSPIGLDTSATSETAPVEPNADFAASTDLASTPLLPVTDASAVTTTPVIDLGDEIPDPVYVGPVEDEDSDTADASDLDPELFDLTTAVATDTLSITDGSALATEIDPSLVFTDSAVATGTLATSAPVDMIGGDAALAAEIDPDIRLQLALDALEQANQMPELVLALLS